jgi:hypothetical protein
MGSKLLLVRLGRSLCITSLSIKVSSFQQIRKRFRNVVNSLKCLSFHLTSSLHPRTKPIHIPIPSMDLTFLLLLRKLFSERVLNFGCANKSKIARIIDITYSRNYLSSLKFFRFKHNCRHECILSHKSIINYPFNILANDRFEGPLLALAFKL